MHIIEIVALDNGAHRNQNGGISTIPEGWAVIPNDLETPNFPFGELEAELINGRMTVVSWTPGEIPEPEPQPEPTTDYVTWDELAQAYNEGVNSVG